MYGRKRLIVVAVFLALFTLLICVLNYTHSSKLVERQKEKMLNCFEDNHTTLNNLITYMKQNSIVIEGSREDGYVLYGGEYVWLPEISPLIAELYAEFSARDIAWETVGGTVSMSICRYHSINRVEISLVYSETDLSGEYGHTLISDNWYLRVWALT